MEATLTPALVDGERVGAVAGATLDVINPSTNKVIGQIPALRRARRRGRGGRRETGRARLAVDRAPAARGRAARLRRRDRAARGEELSRLDSLDNGSPLHEMRNDIGLATSQIRYMAGLALEVRGRTMPETPGRLHYTVHEPFGVAARIIAFNHPLMFAGTKIAAPLLAGNSVILKPSEFTSLSALAMAEDLQRLFPPGVVQVLTGLGAEVGDALVRHPGIPQDRVHRQRRHRAADPGQRRGGGREDRDPRARREEPDRGLPRRRPRPGRRGRDPRDELHLAGPVLRLDLAAARAPGLLRRLRRPGGERIAAMRPGSPLDPASDTGAIVTRQQLDKVLSYIEVGKSEHARLVTGGERLTEGALADGNFVSPALFADVDPYGRLATEEIFGPVLAAIPFAGYDEALAIANSVEYGLTASVFTRDLRTAMAFSRDVEAGYVWVNETARHFLGAPFGGVKNSGVGREEDLSEIESYTQLKSVNISSST